MSLLRYALLSASFLTPIVAASCCTVDVQGEGFRGTGPPQRVTPAYTCHESDAITFNGCSRSNGLKLTCPLIPFAGKIYARGQTNISSIQDPELLTSLVSKLPQGYNVYYKEVPAIKEVGNTYSCLEIDETAYLAFHPYLVCYNATLSGCAPEDPIADNTAATICGTDPSGINGHFESVDVTATEARKLQDNPALDNDTASQPNGATAGLSRLTGLLLSLALGVFLTIFH